MEAEISEGEGLRGGDAELGVTADRESDRQEDAAIFKQPRQELEDPDSGSRADGQFSTTLIGNPGPKEAQEHPSHTASSG